jgi:hypothetical protein
VADEPEQRGFTIGDRFYPVPESYRVCDPVLIREVTGLDWRTFAGMLDDPDYEEDPVLGAGVIAVALWQRHDGWPRARVVDYVAKLDMNRLTFIGPTSGGADAGPPAQAEDGASTSSISPPPSSTAADSPSDDTSQTSTGTPPSAASSD